MIFEHLSFYFLRVEESLQVILQIITCVPDKPLVFNFEEE